MHYKFVDSIQRFLKWAIPCLLIFSFFYALNESQTSEIVIIDFTGDDQQALQQLKEDGHLTNPFMYATLSLAVELGLDIQAGAVEIKKFMGPFALMAALTSPEYKYIAFNEGLRREEIAEIIADKLDWPEEKKQEFAASYPLCTFSGGEGYLFPGKYLVHRDESPKNVRKQMEEKVFEVIKSAAPNARSVSILNTHQILTIASLIQREAAGSQDMNLISGVIWNRIFLDMPLQIDATLQYAKADGTGSRGWWPMPYSEDKYIDSPFNTYLNKGLPPSPIANPGEDAIAAAMQPTDTDCLYYIHDRNRNIHCASDYDQHKRNIRRYLK